MSYSGFTERICEHGHYTTVTCGESSNNECSFCKKPIRWEHPVDTTNGTERDNPGTFAADKISMGWIDISHLDHYGNKYYTKLDLFFPKDVSLWNDLSKIRK